MDRRTTPLARGSGAGRRGRTWLRVVGILAALLVLAAIAVTVWGSRRYHQLLDIGMDAQQRTAKLNQTYPFNPQTTPVRAERVREMLRIRQMAQGDLPPGLTQLVEQARGATSMEELTGLAARALQVAPEIETASNRMFDLLEKERMSPAEYQYLLGLAVYEAMRQNDAAVRMNAIMASGGAAGVAAGAGAKAAQGYRDLLERLGKMTRANNDPSDDFDPMALPTSLAKRYGEQRLPEARTTLEQLDASAPGMLAMDLAISGMKDIPMPEGAGK